MCLLGTAAVAIAVGTPAVAENVRLESLVLRETVSHDGGERVRHIERVDDFRSGERVITILRWRAEKAAPFWVDSPVPGAVVVAALPAGALARRDDSGRITHLRWRIEPNRSGQRGQVSYAGFVR